MRDHQMDSRTFKSTPLFFALILLIQVSVYSQSKVSWEPLDSLLKRMQRYSDSIVPQARLGISIRTVQGDSVLASIRGKDWFVPASTLKILVTAASLDTFELDAFPETRLSLEGRKIGKAFHGNVRVIGGGDPNISGRYLDDAMIIPWAMVDSIKSYGIDTLYGMILADTSLYQGSRRPKGWTSRFFNTWYGAEISALSFNDNCFRIVVIPGAKVGEPAQVRIEPQVGYVRVEGAVETVAGRRNNVRYDLKEGENRIVISGQMGLESQGFSAVLPVRKPSDYYLAALKTAMSQRGLVWVESRKEASRAVWSIPFRSVPVLSIIDEVNQRSQNLHAEMLLRNLAALRFGEGTSEAGLMAERVFLKRLGLQEQDFYLVDGCGLSPENRIKPDAMSLLLARMLRHPRGSIYYQSLAAPGITGASGKRLADINEPHRTRIKTGFINNVQGLVGYIATTRGDTLAVALHLNGYKGPDFRARDMMDTLWSWLMVQQNAESNSMLLVRSLYSKADTIQGYHKRLDWFSKALEGTPYLLGPTGEGMGNRLEAKPLLNMESFDCVTFLEHVMALATAPSADSVWSLLQNIRYEKGEISYRKRKHYFVEDWIGKSPQWVHLKRQAGDTVVHRVMDKKKFFADKRIVWADSNPTTAIPYLPMDKALLYAEAPWTGPHQVLGVGFMTNLPNICVSHTGFVILTPGERPKLRHASQLKKMVITQPLKEYLESRKGKSPGIVLFDFNSPSN